MSETNGGLSQEEFLRLQEQLIDLRNVNYELRERLRKHSVGDGAEPVSAKKEALQFASRLLNRSKDKEAGQRFESEIECLKTKLAVQEEEFRLQQQTFIAELNKVVKNCETLQRELADARSSTSTADCTTKDSLQFATGKVERLNMDILELKRENDEMTVLLEDSRQRVALEGQKVAEKDAFIRALEDTVLQLRQEVQSAKRSMTELESSLSKTSAENQDLKTNLEESLATESFLKSKLESELANVLELQRRCVSLEETEEESKKLATELNETVVELQEKTKAEAEQRRRDKEELSQNFQFLLDKQQENTKAALAQNNEFREKLVFFEKALTECEATHKAEMEDIIVRHREQSHALEMASHETNRLGTDQVVRELNEKHSKELEEMKANMRKEKNDFEKKMEEFAMDLAAKDEEKQLALKKQAHLVKELQKAVREERKRADSVEKIKEREWQVVDTDARSANTYDGNDSISSLSALESDNVELINKLTNLQKNHAEVVDRLRVVETENERFRREVMEKGELIEHWIRTRPQTTSSSSPLKPESVLRKFLSTTLAGDEQVSDLRDMNRKLQRMLEETLSKNLILQRDLQTLIERTEM